MESAWALLKDQFHSAPLYDDLRNPTPRDAYDTMADKRWQAEDQSEESRDLEDRYDQHLDYMGDAMYPDDEEGDLSADIDEDYLEMLRHYLDESQERQRDLDLDYASARKDYDRSVRYHDPQAIEGREEEARERFAEGIEPIVQTRQNEFYAPTPYGVSPPRYDEPTNPFQKAWAVLKNWDNVDWSSPPPKPTPPKTLGDDVDWKSEKELPPIRPMFPPSDAPPAPPGKLAEALAAARDRPPEPPLQLERLPPPSL